MELLEALGTWERRPGDLLHTVQWHRLKSLTMPNTRGHGKTNPHVLLEERLESTLESDVQFLVELEIHRPAYVLHTRETRAHGCRGTLRRILAVPPCVRKPNYKHLNVHQLENG